MSLPENLPAGFEVPDQDSSMEEIEDAIQEVSLDETVLHGMSDAST